MSDNNKFTPFADAQLFFISKDGEIYQWISNQLKNLNEKWAPAIVPLRLFNLIYEKHAYILAHKSEPLLVDDYFQKSEPEKFNALFLQSQFNTQMASAKTHVIIRSLILKSLFMLNKAEAGRTEKASSRMLESCVSYLQKQIERTEKQKLSFEGESIYEVWWCFKEKWAKVQSDLLLFEDNNEKIDFLQKIRALELDKSQDSSLYETKYLVDLRDAYFSKIDNKLSGLNKLTSSCITAKIKEPEVTDLRFLFQDDEGFEPFMNFLVTSGTIDSSFLWIVRDKSLAYKSRCICLIKSLHQKGYLIRKPTNKEIVLICSNNFRVSVSIDTVKKAKPNKYRGFLNEIPHSKHLPIPPNPDHSTN